MGLDPTPTYGTSDPSGDLTGPESVYLFFQWLFGW